MFKTILEKNCSEKQTNNFFLNIKQIKDKFKNKNGCFKDSWFKKNINWEEFLTCRYIYNNNPGNMEKIKEIGQHDVRAVALYNLYFSIVRDVFSPEGSECVISGEMAGESLAFFNFVDQNSQYFKKKDDDLILSEVQIDFSAKILATCLKKSCVLYEQYLDAKEEYDNGISGYNYWKQVATFYDRYHLDESSEIITDIGKGEPFVDAKSTVSDNPLNKENRNFFYKHPKKCVGFGLILFFLFVYYLLKKN